MRLVEGHGPPHDESALPTRYWSPAVSRPSPQSKRSSVKTSKPTSRGSVRRRASSALVESTMLESVLDRILVNRLRPLRADATAARKAFEEQVTLRVEADARAIRLEAEAQRLRGRVDELEQELTTAQQRRSGWFRRRAIVAQPAAQAAAQPGKA